MGSFGSWRRSQPPSASRSFCASSALCIPLQWLTFCSLLPETLRKIVGNGSIPPPVHLRPVLPFLLRYDKNAKRPRTRLSNASTLQALKTLAPRFLKHTDILAILCSNSAAFALFQALSATISPVLFESYPFLTQTTVRGSPFPLSPTLIFPTRSLGRFVFSPNWVRRGHWFNSHRTRRRCRVPAARGHEGVVYTP